MEDIGHDPIHPTELASVIDISAVRANSSRADVERLVELGVAHSFASAHVLAHWVPTAKALRPTPVALPIGAPVGFPSGGAVTAVKIAELRALLYEGIDEVDVVANTARLISGEGDYVADELAALATEVGGAVTFRAIFECYFLDEDQLCQACDIAMSVGADYIKTGTGWAPGGTTLKVVKTLSERAAGRIGLKAAGGIRDLHTARAMLGAGVTRLGVNVSDAIRLVHESSGVDAVDTPADVHPST